MLEPRGPTGWRTRAAGRGAALALCLWLTACSAVSEVPGEHILMFDRTGRALDPASGAFGFDQFSPPDFSVHAAKIAEAIRAQKPAAGPGTPRRLLIYVHGGLNEQAGTVERAGKLHERIEAAGYYPLFLNWDSSLLSSYWEHLWWVRQGADRGWAGTILGPFYFAADVGRGAFRLPMIWWWRLREYWYENTSIYAPERHAADLVTGRRQEHGAEIQAAVADAGLQLHFVASDSDEGRSWWDSLSSIVTLPFKIVGTFIVDVGGTPSWEVMQRRVTLLFEHEQESGLPRLWPQPTQLREFLQQLAQLQDDLAPQGGLELTLVGHSMGTMIVNRILEHAAEPGTPRITNLVYMAAACSVREYEGAAFPYLTQHPETRLFHLVLDPDSETREANVLDLAPRGSLLVWIDDFLANPLTLADRTAGRYENLMPALHHTPAALRSRLFVQYYDDGVSCWPQKHGDFGEPMPMHRFWDPGAWWRGTLPALNAPAPNAPTPNAPALSAPRPDAPATP
ncbi:MAG: hypothetical protein ACT4PU_03535 [Planctomycetota bacterium]